MNEDKIIHNIFSWHYQGKKPVIYFFGQYWLIHACRHTNIGVSEDKVMGWMDSAPHKVHHIGLSGDAVNTYGMLIYLSSTLGICFMNKIINQSLR